MIDSNCTIIDLFIGFFSLILFAIIVFIFCNFLFSVDEKDCFNFYKENGYILDTCSKYESKLRGDN